MGQQMQENIDKRLATGYGTSVRDAEMDAAAQALLTHSDLFPASFMAMSLFALCNENKKSDGKKDEEIVGDEAL
uniref:Uncharacterized protein n=1 Tax=Panagrolaimus davidi TaxID=227884 RepID=A0A914QR10_9BILA